MLNSADGSKTIGVGLLGCGNVGAALVALLQRERLHIRTRTALDFEVAKVAVRDIKRDRGVGFAPGVLTTDVHSVVEDPEVDVVVELMGGIEPAKTLITAALEAGKPVVTGNKELIASEGTALDQLAAENGTVLLYEAAVAGGIPVMRPLRESLAGEPITHVMGIVNGTTNYILTRMTEDGADYGDALVDAQAKGYAEADPTADVEAFDAAAKASIIANVAFGASMSQADVYREGIAKITAEDIDLAGRLGFVVKLLAVVEKSGEGKVGVRVHPTMVPRDHPLASVRLSFNAVFVQGASVGNLMFYGPGAGGGPTASAVLGDLVDASRRKLTGAAVSPVLDHKVGHWPIEEQSSAFYVSLDVADRPGVLSAVSGVFGADNIPIRSMEQLGFADEAKLIFVTHSALESSMTACLAKLSQLDSVRRIGNVMRVLET